MITLRWCTKETTTLMRWSGVSCVDCHWASQSDATRNHGSRSSLTRFSLLFHTGITCPFPMILHQMLESASIEGFSDICSWQPHVSARFERWRRRCARRDAFHDPDSRVVIGTSLSRAQAKGVHRENHATVLPANSILVIPATAFTLRFPETYQAE